MTDPNPNPNLAPDPAPADPAANPPADNGTPPAGNPPAGDPAPKPAAKPADVLDTGDPATNPKPGDKPAAAAAFPEDWRQQIAGEDAKFLKELGRFASPKALADSYREMANKISKGEFKRPLAADATPEQVAEWRKENDIPAEAKGYDLSGVEYVIGDADKPLVEDFSTAIHEQNLTNKQMNAVLNWYYGAQEKQVSAIAAHDVDIAKNAIAEMKQEWGGEYEANKTSVLNYLNATMPEGSVDELLLARTPSGALVKNNPAMLRWIVGQAMERDPAATVVTQGGARGAQAIDDELASISKARKENPDAYFKNEKMQSRERELLDAKEKIKIKS